MTLESNKNLSLRRFAVVDEGVGVGRGQGPIQSIVFVFCNTVIQSLIEKYVPE